MGNAYNPGMTNERPEPRFHYAPPGTLAGKLQRGLGSGFLEALKTPREVLHPLLMDCVAVDPALDIHLDHREWYYGELAFRTGLPVHPLAERVESGARDEAEEDTLLALDVLVHLTKRGERDADEWLRDYVRWGSYWHYVCSSLDRYATTPEWFECSATIARRADADAEYLPLSGEPFESWARTDTALAPLTDTTARNVYRRRTARFARRIQQSTTASLLNWAGAGGTSLQIAELSTRTSVEDLSAIEQAVADPSPMIRAIALGAQFLRGDFRHFDLCLHMATTEQRPPAASGVARRAILRAPADVLLPYARKWKSSRVWYRRHFASQVFELHATEEDLTWLMAGLKRASSSEPDERFIVTNLADIVAARFPGREFPALRRKFDGFTYSYGRQHIAEALAVTDPTFSTTRAFTSLWDCESGTRLVAAENVSLDVPGAIDRLREIAADPLEDDDRIKAVAARRLGDPRT